MSINNLRFPSDIIDSAHYVMARAEHVTFDDANLPQVAELVRKRFKKGFGSIDDAFGSTRSLDQDVNLIYFETAANFCFWSQEPKNKWQVEYQGNVQGGWYGLRNVFVRAIKNKLPVYDATYMSALSIEKAKELFRGENDSIIPLLEQRVNNIVEAANFLLENYNGSALQFVESCQYDAPTIAREITRSLSSYRDCAFYKGRLVWILKRAQIFPNDLSQLTSLYPNFVIKNKDMLTIFADYKLPQLLRYFGIINYSNALTEHVDNRGLVTNGSEEEIEIRMATIVAGQKLAELCPGMTIADIDVSLWLLSKEPSIDKKLQPHHMTVSMFY